jgi:hypothetical protein
VVLTEVEERNHDTSNDRPLFEQVRWEKRLWRKLLAHLPKRECNKQHAADDQHRNHTTIAPPATRVWSQRERQQNECYGCREQQQARSVQIEPDVLQNLKRTATMKWARDVEPQVLRTSLVHEQTDSKWNEANRKYDSPNTVSPSPGGIVKDRFSQFWPSEGSPEERQVEQGREKSAIEQIGCIGDEDLL